jgi:histone H3/H4
MDELAETEVKTPLPPAAHRRKGKQPQRKEISDDVVLLKQQKAAAIAKASAPIIVEEIKKATKKRPAAAAVEEPEAPAAAVAQKAPKKRAAAKPKEPEPETDEEEEGEAEAAAEEDVVEAEGTVPEADGPRKHLRRHGAKSRQRAFQIEYARMNGLKLDGSLKNHIPDPDRKEDGKTGMFPRLPVERVIREILQEYPVNGEEGTSLRIKKRALNALHLLSENFVNNVFSYAAISANHRKAKTIEHKDMELAMLFLFGESHAASYFAVIKPFGKREAEQKRARAVARKAKAKAGKAKKSA